MNRVIKWAVALAAPALLSGCFVLPGKFGSTLDVRKDGTFSFAYKGEILFQSPDDVMKGKPEVWSDDKAVCYAEESAVDAVDTAAEAAGEAADAASGAMEAATNAVEAPATEDSYSSSTRDCTKAEIAEQKQEFLDNQKAAAASKEKDAAGFAAMFGFNPTDDKSMTEFAAKMSKYQGWKSVVHQGKGKFLVDYQYTGKISHDFIFPILPDGDVIFPFVQIRVRPDGKLFVNTPALLGGGMGQLAAKARAMGAPADKDGPDLTGILDGSFTLSTDGEFLTNNSEEGPTRTATGGRTITWKINAETKKIPEALIQLN